MIRLSLASLLAASALGATAAQAQPADATSLAHDKLAWVTMAPGIEFAPAFGDWNKEAHGKFVRFAPGAAVPAQQSLSRRGPAAGVRAGRQLVRAGRRGPRQHLRLG